MSSQDDQFVALGPTPAGFITSGTNIDVGAYIAGNRLGVWGDCDNGFGVYGETFDPNSSGVAGISGNAVGMWGQGPIGVFGQSSSPTGTAVFGENTSNGFGVWGTSDSAVGVVGQGKNGIYGQSSSPDGIGVFGENMNRGVGVFGSVGSNERELKDIYSPPNIGVVGWGGNPTVELGLFPDTGYGGGVFGMSNGSDGVLGWSRYNYGVQGISGPEGEVSTGPFASRLIQVGTYGAAANSVDNGAAVGVQGLSRSDGAGATPIGVFGSTVTKSASATAVGVGAYAYGGSQTYGVYAEALGSDGAGVYAINAVQSAGYAIVGYGSNGKAANFVGAVTISGGLVVTGSKSAAVPVRDGSHRLLYSMESPESWFEDFGEMKLVRGKATVRLARDFAAVIRTKAYHVFLTPQGDSNGLYVARMSSIGFVVREQNGGSSSLMFSYRIVAKRRDIEGKRLMKIRIQTPAKPPKLPAVLRSLAGKAPAKRKEKKVRRLTRIRIPKPPKPPKLPKALLSLAGKASLK